MVLYGDDHALHRQVQFLCSALDDADVGLMRHDPIDIFGADAGAVHCGIGGGGKFLDRVAKHLIALHPQVAGGAGRHAAIDVEQIAVAPVRIQIRRENAPVGRTVAAVLRLKQQRARAIAKRREIEIKLLRLKEMCSLLDDLIAGCPGSGELSDCTILGAIETHDR